ncbi:MAG TPA: metallophosphoesterase [Candidatus Thermoplasmatota archaeon]|nr:metallophosphoesterase [Candidatus Thermoplasmatota archaeon]
MKVGILSDTHDNLPLVEAAARFFRDEGIERVLHLGDVTKPRSLEPLKGFRLTTVQGNNDGALPELPVSWAGEVGGVPVAATHGHLSDFLQELVASRRYAFVFRGHSHKAGVTREGETTVVNPGALHRAAVKSVCVLDTATRGLAFYAVEAHRVAPWTPPAAAPKRR